MLASGLMFNSMSLYNLVAESKPGELKFEAKGMKKIDGKPAYVVQVKPAKGATVKLFFDENFMWVRTEYGSAKYCQSNETQVLNRNMVLDLESGRIQKIGQTSII